MEMTLNFAANNYGNLSVSSVYTSVKPRNTRDIVLPSDEYNNFLCVNFHLFCCSCQTDIDECSDGFVQCDSRANCINLPGWYHCECRDGYHDNGMFSPSGESCEGQYLKNDGVMLRIALQ